MVRKLSESEDELDDEKWVSASAGETASTGCSGVDSNPFLCISPSACLGIKSPLRRMSESCVTSDFGSLLTEGTPKASKYCDKTVK